ncbi:hypothetical protein, partial [Georgenia thermotolerans]
AASAGAAAASSAEGPAEAGPAGMAARQRQVEAQLDRLHANYARHFAAVEARTDPFDVPLSYDLRLDILAALTDLRRAVGHIEDDAEDRW